MAENRKSGVFSQQLAPAEQILPEQPISRDELTRKSTRHEPLPEKHLPQYPSLPKQPQQQLAPCENELPRKAIPRDEIKTKPTKHDPLPKKQLAEYPNSLPKQPHEQFAPRDPLLSRQPLATENMVRNQPDHHALPGQQETLQPSESNGDLPHDQVIPLEELPNDQRTYPQQPPVLVEDQPLLRRPRRRRTDQSKNYQYDSRHSLCLGILLIIIGILEIILNAIGIIFQQLFRQSYDTVPNIVFFLAPGFWCSIFFILAGTFGVIAGRGCATWAIVTHLVVATLASTFGCILLAMSGWGIQREIIYSETINADLHLPSLIIMCLMALGALVAIPLTIWASVLCCKLFCHKPQSNQDGYRDF